MIYAIHYFINGRPRCGQPRWRNWTTNPVLADCKTCERLMKGEMK
jgi:hypothetical protein